MYVGVDSALYQFISILSLKMSDCMAALQYAYNQATPTTAVGAGLDRIVKLNGIARKPYTYSTALLTVNGTAGTVITNGAAQDTNGNTWLLPSPMTIPGGGTINVTATCVTAGNITAGAGAIDSIATPVGGWTSVNNANPAVPGNPIETDSQLRARQAISVALPSETRLAGTIADLSALLGVTRLNVLENPTNSTDSYGNPPHSLTCVVEGGTQLGIATTIYNNRGIGCLTNGKVSGSPISQTVDVTVTDPNTGNTMVMEFINPPAYVPIFVILNVHLLPGGTSATLAAIQTAVTNYLNSLQIGEAVIFSELWGAALTARSNPDIPIFSIHSIFSGVAPSPSGTVDLPILFYQVSSGILANVIVNSV